MKTLAALIVFPLIALLAAPQAFARDDDAFSEGELRQLLAPVALYPDGLLSQVLIASTYPLEVVEAARWSRANPGFEGQAAVDAVAGKDWDPNVRALVAFPDLIARMSEELEWTRRLGEAFLLQEDEVIAAVQDLRARAEAAGSLDRLEHARAYRSNDVIIIEPRDTRVIYVPYYSPRIVYGGWGWSAYPPYYWYPPPGYYASTGFWWGGGVVLSSAYFISGFDWRYRHIVILSHYRPHYRYVDSPRWRHDPKHRRGVVYRQPALSRQFSRAAPTTPQAQPSTQQGAPRPALRRQPGAYYSSGDRQTTSAGDDGRRAGATTQLRSGSPGGDRTTSGLRRSGGDTIQRNAQQTESASTDDSAATPPVGIRPGSRTGNRTDGLQRAEPARTTRGSALSTPRSDAARGAQSSRSSAPSPRRDTRGVQSSPGAAAPTQQRPSFSGGGDGGRGSALRGLR